MIIENKKKQIKKLQRESEIYKHIIVIINDILHGNDLLINLYCNRVSITEDGSMAIIYMHSYRAREMALEDVKKINTYKKQIRHRLSQSLSYKRSVKINFVYDEMQGKVDKINKLLDSLRDVEETKVNDEV